MSSQEKQQTFAELTLATEPEVILAMVKAIPSPVYSQVYEVLGRALDEVHDEALVHPRQAQSLADNFVRYLQNNTLPQDIHPIFRTQTLSQIERLDLLNGPARYRLQTLWKDAIKELPSSEQKLAWIEYAKVAKQKEITPLEALTKALEHFQVNLPAKGTFAQAQLDCAQLNILSTLRREAVDLQADEVSKWIENYIWNLYKDERGERLINATDPVVVGKTFAILAKSRLDPSETAQVVDETVEDSMGIIKDVLVDDACVFYLARGDVQKARVMLYKIEDPVVARQSLSKVIEYYVHKQDWAGLDSLIVAFSSRWEGIFDEEDIERLVSEAFLDYLYPPEFPRDDLEGERILARGEFMPHLETDFAALVYFTRFVAEGKVVESVKKLAERILQEKINEYNSGKLDSDEAYHFLRLLLFYRAKIGKGVEAKTS